MDGECSICNGKADALFKRIEVWSNRRWRLTTTTYRAVKGLCYLEPVRHIRYITEIDGHEASEFGPVLSSAASALKAATGAELIYVYIYGGHIPHLHVHLAPHRQGDVFFDDLVKEGIELSEEVMPAEEVAAVSRGIGMNMPGKSSTG